MKPSSFVRAFGAGLAATAIMSGMNELAPTLGLPKLDFPRLLGGAVTPKPQQAKRLGWVLQFLHGGLLACGYALIWNSKRAKPSAASGGVLGLAHGAVAALSMPLMLRVHPRPPEMELDAPAIAGIVGGHTLYGAVVGAVYGRAEDAAE